MSQNKNSKIRNSRLIFGSALILVSGMTYQNCADGFHSISSINSLSNINNDNSNNDNDNNNTTPLPSTDSFKGKLSPLYEFGKPKTKLIVSGKDIYFQADNGLTGNELWKYDATTKTNRLVTDLNAGLGGSDIGGVTPLENGVAISTRGGPFTIGNSSGSDFLEKIYYVSNQNQNSILVAQAINPGGQDGQFLNEFKLGNTYFYSKQIISGNTTTAQTFRVDNGVATPISNNFSNFGTVIGNKFLFISQSSGRALSSYDGKTYSMIKDFPDGGPLYFSYVSNSEVYFFSIDAQVCRLWRSDGTPARTVPITTVTPSNRCYIDNYPVVKMGADIYFSYNEQLMKVDTNGGVQALAKSPRVVTVVGNKVIFDGGVTDGTNAGTKLIPGITGAGLEFRFGPHPEWLVLNNKMYVVLNSSFSNFVPTLSVYDPANDSLQALDSSVEPQITSFNGRVYYLKSGGLTTPSQLKSTDGTLLGTVSHQDLAGRGYDIVSTSVGVFFQAPAAGSARFSPWYFDGAKSTLLNSFALPVDKLSSFSTRTQYLGTAGTKRYFLFSSSGQAANSSLISHDIVTGVDKKLDTLPGSVRPNDFKFIGNTLFYIKNSNEFRKTNGVSSEPIGIDFANSIFFNLIGVLGQKLIVSVGLSNKSSQSWVIDGVTKEKITDTLLGNTPIIDSTGAYFLSLRENSTVPLIGFSNGTAAGTTVLLDVATLNPGINSSVSAMFKLGSRLIFSVSSSANCQLWSLDIATKQPTKLKEVDTTLNLFLGKSELASYDGLFATPITNFAAVGNNLYFLITNSAPASQLWATDGTVAGTTLITDRTGIMQNLKATNQILFYYLRTGFGNSSLDLYSYNGVALTLIKAGLPTLNDNTLPSTSVPDYTIYNNKAYFSFNDPATGVEIWESDGTTANTKLAYDVEPGPTSSFPGIWGVINGELVFTAKTKTFERKNFAY